jgi:hypothetical protein
MSLDAVRKVLRVAVVVHIAPTVHAVNRRDHSEISRFLRQETSVVNSAPDISLSGRCRWLDAHVYTHDELDADELEPQAV